MSLKFLLFCFTTFVVVNSYPVDKEDTPLSIRALFHSYLYEGDILLRKPVKDNAFRNAVPNDYYLWPNGIIPYVIHEKLDPQKDLILKAMSRISKHTCIKFVEKKDSDNEFVHIIKGDGCSATIGRDLDYPQSTLSLGEGCYYPGTITHELMHVIGFYHEHNRHNRDDYLNIYWNNIDPEQVDQFRKLRSDQERIFTTFDYNSVMLYGPTAFSKDGSIVMSPKLDGFHMIPVFEKPGLTKLDAESITKLYKCN